MNIFQRVFITTKRYKWRSLILLGATFLTGFLIVGSLMINHAFNASINQLQRSMPLVFSTTFHAEAQERHILDRNTIYDIGQLPYVSHFDYTMLSTLIGTYQPYWLDQLDMEALQDFTTWAFPIHGVSRPEVIYIESGIYELYDGRLFTWEEIQPETLPTIAPALVSRELAELNGLFIGSRVELMSMELFYLPEGAEVPEGRFTGLEWGEELWNHPYNQSQTMVYEFEIVGIFDFKRILRPNDPEALQHQNMINLLFTPNWRVHEIQSDEINAMLKWADVFNMHEWEGIVELFQVWDSVIPLWVLDNVESILAFTEEANQLLPPAYEICDGLTGTFRPMIETTNQLSRVITQVLWVGSGAMIIVITLLILLYLKERKHELGIYLALGERKVMVIFQMLIEVLMISVIGLVLALLIANIVAENFALSLLSNELASVSQPQLNWPSTLEIIGFGQELTSDELISYFNVSLGLQTTFYFLVAGIGIIIASTVVPVFYVLELNPKELLTQASVQ